MQLSKNVNNDVSKDLPIGQGNLKFKRTFFPFWFIIYFSMVQYFNEKQILELMNFNEVKCKVYS